MCSTWLSIEAHIMSHLKSASEFVHVGDDLMHACRFGHTHWYSRSCPVYRRQCQPTAADGSQTAPVHVNIGNAGASFSWDVVDPALLTQDIYAAFAMQHGYMRVNASRTSLHIQVSTTASAKNHLSWLHACKILLLLLRATGMCATMLAAPAWYHVHVSTIVSAKNHMTWLHACAMGMCVSTLVAPAYTSR